jgi:DNA modification methylase
MTGYVAETMNRRWLSFELTESYLEASKFRFLIEEDEASSQSDTSPGQKRLF